MARSGHRLYSVRCLRHHLVLCPGAQEHARVHVGWLAHADRVSVDPKPRYGKHVTLVFAHKLPNNLCLGSVGVCWARDDHGHQGWAIGASGTYHADGQDVHVSLDQGGIPLGS